jgi:hypothetical protein
MALSDYLCPNNVLLPASAEKSWEFSTPVAGQTPQSITNEQPNSQHPMYESKISSVDRECNCGDGCEVGDSFEESDRRRKT